MLPSILDNVGKRRSKLDNMTGAGFRYQMALREYSQLNADSNSSLHVAW